MEEIDGEPILERPSLAEAFFETAEPEIRSVRLRLTRFPGRREGVSESRDPSGTRRPCGSTTVTPPAGEVVRHG